MAKCKICKITFEKKSFNQQWCTPECAIELIKLNNQKKAKQKQKEENKTDKAIKQKLKSYSQKLADAKKVFQKWIRERDEHHPCISCGSPTSNPYWDAGHFKKAELYRGVIFNENNVHKQCRKCNFYMDGNELNYRVGLIKKIGIEQVEELEQFAEQTKIYKYTDDELQLIKIKYK